MFYPGQVELIKSTRKVLKQKVRECVDKVGPKLYKNFDKMRLVMLKPGRGKSGEEKLKYSTHKRTSSARKTTSTAIDENLNPVSNEEIKNVGNSELGELVLPVSRFSSSRRSNSDEFQNE